MPEIFHQPLHRRDYLKFSLLAGAAVVAGAGRSHGETPESAGSFHLALLSDTHVPGDRKDGHRGMNPWENLKRIVPEVVEAAPEGVILNGDAARLSGRVEDYQELKALLAPVAENAPVYIGMGNHDDRASFAKVFAKQEAKQGPGGREVLVIEHAVVRVLVLDSLLYVNQVAGLLGKAQRGWLVKWLERNSDRPVVVFVHHTLGDGDGDLLDADRLFAILKPHPQVKAVFYGHSHVWNVSERQGVKLINLPAVGYNFSDREPVGWVDAKFDASGADLTLRAFGGNLKGNGGTTRVDWG